MRNETRNGGDRTTQMRKIKGWGQTMLRMSSLTSSSDPIMTARAMSGKLRVTYVAVSFLSAQRDARSIACCTKPRFFSYS